MALLKQTPLPYAKTALEPVMSKDTIDYHYSHLYKRYVDHYNDGEGRKGFNEAGAFLHDIFFTQFTKLNKDQPGELTEELIHKHHYNLEDLKEEMLEAAMKMEGSGWIYLATDGTIKSIPNHEICKDIILLIDLWEHAWALQYKWDRKKYVESIWSIINWPHIEDRVALMV